MECWLKFMRRSIILLYLHVADCLIGVRQLLAYGFAIRRSQCKSLTSLQMADPTSGMAAFFHRQH
jgi:hypothetical protein